MRTFAIGDIHGRYDALIEVILKSKFDYETDKLIVLGDVCDGDVSVSECFEELLKMKNLVFVLGNHDRWALQWMLSHKHDNLNRIWWSQGGMYTAASYNYKPENVPLTHVGLLCDAKLYHEENKMVFVHGGFDPDKSMKKQKEHTLLWDRDLINEAKYNIVPGFKKIFVGHTTTQIIEHEVTEPLFFNNLIMLDTGGGWNGKLTIMNVYTEEYWQSSTQIPGPSKSKLKKIYFEKTGKPLTTKEMTNYG